MKKQPRNRGGWINMEKINFDKKNYRKHSDNNKRMIRKSLKDCGAGRSVLVDADGYLIAGNGVYEQAQQLNIPTRVVETDGSELVVVKRTDLRTDDAKRKELALADNATSDSVEWDMQNIAEDFDISVAEDWGIDFGKEQKENKDLSDDISFEYKLEITLSNESEQEQLYNELVKKGYECRILTL